MLSPDDAVVVFGVVPSMSADRGIYGLYVYVVYMYFTL